MKKIKVRKNLPKRIKTIIVMATIILVVAFIYAGLTDIILLRKTEDMIGPKDAISILFVGNSQVFIGELPRQLKTIARANGIEIVYKDLSRHGAMLSDSMDKAISEIRSGIYDYVILHEHAMRVRNSVDEFLRDVNILCGEATKNGVVPILYNTTGWKNEEDFPDEIRQSISTKAYMRAAEENDVLMVNVGDAWIYAYKTMPGISLHTKYDPRGPHASKAGGFFTACVFAAALFDLHVEEIPKDNLYSGRDALKLAQIAWDFIQHSD